MVFYLGLLSLQDSGCKFTTLCLESTESSAIMFARKHCIVMLYVESHVKLIMFVTKEVITNAMLKFRDKNDFFKVVG